jgi:hypothetical protein
MGRRLPSSARESISDLMKADGKLYFSGNPNNPHNRKSSVSP